ncbi:MAG: hypothetical protein INR71_01765 [Terriglobus roseus]|nr:hypothetical protein [Terriglobus roseus]
MSAADPPPPPTTSPSRKRPLEDETNAAETHDGSVSDTFLAAAGTRLGPVGPSAPGAADRATSPSLSSLTSASGDLVDPVNPQTTAPGTAPGAAPQKKRRRLTPAEKQQREAEKEASKREKAETKARRDEERRVEEEERQRRRAEKEEKRRLREFEEQEKKQQKEAAKQRDEEERLKKERSQTKLNAFFTKPKPAPLAAAPAGDAPDQAAAPPVLQAAEEPASDVAPTPPKKQAKSDFDSYFLPFCLPPHAILAPQNHFHNLTRASTSEPHSLEMVVSRAPDSAGVAWFDTFKEDAAQEKRHSVPDTPVRAIVAKMQGSPDKPIDLTEGDAAPALSPLQLLKSVPLKYIHFGQDVRPPYYGTYTKLQSPALQRALSRNAWARALPATDYDYDSEAEWDEPEEGEDIMSDGEDDGEDEGEDDMEGFLDDEGDSPKKRRAVAATELEPNSTGLCWEDAAGLMARADGLAGCPALHGYRMGVLLERAPASIDPFSAAYWEPEPKPAAAAAPTALGASADASSMQPPARVPLQARPNGGNSKIMEDFAGKPSAGKRGPKPSLDPSKPRRMVPPDQLDEFRRAIDGSDLTKIALIEDLKKKYGPALDSLVEAC